MAKGKGRAGSQGKMKATKAKATMKVKATKAKEATKAKTPKAQDPKTQIALNQCRQGDVLLDRVKNLPKKLNKVEPAGGLFILAQGSATGNHHSVPADCAELFQDNEGKMFLMTNKVTKLMHQEHATIDIPVGVWQVLRAQEYTPQKVRNVAD